MGAIQAKVEQVEAWDRIHLKGRIGEGTAEALGKLLEGVGKNCLINFRGITDANSCGIAEWVEFMQKAGADRNVVFEQCPPAIVNVINMIPAFRGNAKVYSVYAPYGCGECGKSQWHLYTSGVNMPEGDQLSDSVEPEEVMPKDCKCNRAFSPQVDLAEFFEFNVD
mgnify:CR=1 FL=1